MLSVWAIEIRVGPTRNLEPIWRWGPVDAIFVPVSVPRNRNRWIFCWPVSGSRTGTLFSPPVQSVSIWGRRALVTFNNSASLRRRRLGVPTSPPPVRRCSCPAVVAMVPGAVRRYVNHFNPVMRRRHVRMIGSGTLSAVREGGCGIGVWCATRRRHAWGEEVLVGRGGGVLGGPPCLLNLLQLGRQLSRVDSVAWCVSGIWQNRQHKLATPATSPHTSTLKS